MREGRARRRPQHALEVGTRAGAVLIRPGVGSTAGRPRPAVLIRSWKVSRVAGVDRRRAGFEAEVVLRGVDPALSRGSWRIACRRSTGGGRDSFLSVAEHFSPTLWRKHHAGNAVPAATDIADPLAVAGRPEARLEADGLLERVVANLEVVERRTAVGKLTAEEEAVVVPGSPLLHRAVLEHVVLDRDAPICRLVPPGPAGDKEIHRWRNSRNGSCEPSGWAARVDAFVVNGRSRHPHVVEVEVARR